MNKKRKPLELYVHIPFCIRKCAYCDFVSGPGTKAMQKEYEEALLAEIDAAEETAESEVISAFFGGGTPSAVDAGMLARVMEKLRSKYIFSEDAEITLEANPGTLDAEKLKCYRKSGFNRISIGCQSVHDEELKRLGRIHTFAEFQESFALARDAGFANINVDLMAALPYQTVESYTTGLRKIIRLAPEHISAYSLILEEGTPFYQKYNSGCYPLPDEEQERLMYRETEQILAQAGYERYEISNYAKKGYACRHNLVYWQGGDYLGLGLGSSSYMDGVRFHNTTDFNTYVNQGAYVEDREELSVQAKMEEFMFLGLRVMAGVSGTEFEKRFGKTMEDVYGDVLRKHEEEGLLQIERKEDRKEAAAAEPAKGKTNIEKVMLTTNGVDVSNYVFADFLL